MPIKPRFDLSVHTQHADGGVCTNVFHFTGPGAAPTTADLQTAADTASTAFAGALKPIMPAANKFLGVELRYVAVNNSRYAASETAAGNGTIVTGDPEDNLPGATGLLSPADLAIVVRKIGNGPVKNATGTTYIGCLDESMHYGSRPSIAFAAVWSAIRNVILAPLTVGGQQYPASILSRKTDTLYAVQEASYAPVLGRMRSRRPQR